MALDVKLETPVPFPFDFGQKPTTSWAILDTKRVGLNEACVVLVLRNNKIVTLPLRTLVATELMIPNWFILQFPGHEVKVEGGLCLPQLYLAIVRGESCVIYEWKDEWMQRPPAMRLVKDIIIKKMKVLDSEGEAPPTPKPAVGSSEKELSKVH